MRKLKTEDINRLSVEDFKKAAKNPLVLVLDNIRSLHNVGSFFRTADAFRVERIFLCGITAVPPHREIHKTALGATDSVDWEYVETAEAAVNRLKKEGCLIAAVEQTDKSILLNDFHVPVDRNLVLVFGNEVQGVSENVVALADACVEIPQGGTKHSLNVTVSAGIVLWDISLKTWGIDWALPQRHQ